MRSWRNFDWLLLCIPVVLTLFGTVMLYAISRWAPDVPPSTPVRQLGFLIAGVGLFWVMVNVDYRVVRRFIWPAYVITLGSLVAVTLVGHSSFGAQRWISVGGVQIEPSEMAKLVVGLTLARFLSDREDLMGSPLTFLGSIAIAGMPALLVLRQPDFGTAMVIVAVWFAAVVMAATPVPYLGGAAALSGLAAPFTWSRVLKPFQRSRLTSFLDPNKDPLNTGWNIIHARIAVGSGGLFGQWFSKATQSRLDFLRVQDKDFIFSVIAEQIGFAGVLIIFLLFALFLMRIARVAFMSADSFGRLAGVTILSMFLFQAFVNIGMNVGIMPVTGIPLPLLSYGGSSLISCFVALGILESILLRHKKLIFGRAQTVL